jgi:hypothetical protein
MRFRVQGSGFRVQRFSVSGFRGSAFQGYFSLVDLFCKIPMNLEPLTATNIPNSVLEEKNNEKFEEFGKLKAKFYRNV